MGFTHFHTEKIYFFGIFATDSSCSFCLLLYSSVFSLLCDVLNLISTKKEMETQHILLLCILFFWYLEY